MRKSMIIGVTVILLTGLVSAKFITIDPGKGKQTVDTDKVNSVQTKNTNSNVTNKDFVSIYGDKLKGALDMSGFGLTGLPTPDDPEDAATKSYVDDTLSEVYVSASNTSSSGTPKSTLSDVLARGNVADRVIRFSNGVGLGDSETSAVENSIAIGNGAEAKENNSVAIGAGSKATQEDTMTLGSTENALGLTVSGDTVIQGDLKVEGQIKGLNTSDSSTTDNTTKNSDNTSESQTSPVYISKTIEVDTNGTEVDISHLDLNSTNYQVSATSVGSITNVGVFNKTLEKVTLRSESFTKTDIVLTSK